MASQSPADLLASSVQRTVLGVLIGVLWIGSMMTIPTAVGEGLPGTAAGLLLTIVAGGVIVALFIEGVREG